MLFRDVAYLCTITFTENDLGDIVETLAESLVYVNKKSVRQSEYYQAQATGLKPELMLEIRTIDYNDEERLKFDNKYYNIIRNFSKNGEITELICNRLVNS
jgi:SPP1 family predicted phage head-tail adaptor